MKLILIKNIESVRLTLKIFMKIENKKENIKFSDLELIFKDLKSLFEKGIYY